MKYVSYILIFILAVVAGFLVFRQFRGTGDLTKDFDLRSEVGNEQPVIDNEDVGISDTDDTLGLLDDINTSGDSPADSVNQAPRDQGSDIEYTEVGEEIMITDGVKHLVPLDKILGGGPPKDGIPSIDDPKFISVKQADEFLDDDKLGIAVEKDGDWRFYPFQILVWHEIVNDVFKGENLLVTYCPLCLTGIVFTPEVDGELVEFGTSGRLFNSNLVMYDRKTDTLWSQAGGRAIVGKEAGSRLEIRAADNVFWGEFKKAHPNAEVLSRDTGQARDYTRDPYGDYYTTSGTYFPVENTDDRLFDKAITYGLDINGQTKAYSEEAIKRDSIINDTFAGKKLLIVIDPETKAIRFFDRSVNDNVLSFDLSQGDLLDNETGSQWSFSGQGISGAMLGKQLIRVNPEFGFWFAWVAFNPNTELYN